MTDEDDRLLQRLNALKPSTVRLQREKKPLDFDTQSPGLFASSGVGGAGVGAGAGALYGSLEGPSGTAIEDGIAPETLFDGDAIDDLLASLDRPHDLALQSLNVDTSDQARDILTDANEFIKDSSVRQRETILQRDNSTDFPAHNDDNSSSDEEEDEAEAARYVERILSQVNGQPFDDLQNKHSSSQESDPHTPDNKDYNDDTLSQTLTAFSLPSVPADLPGTKKEHAEEKTQAEFCCVCYDTATTKCLDCEGNQFFCIRCWKEMHVGEEAIWADQPHKRVKI